MTTPHEFEFADGAFTPVDLGLGDDDLNKALEAAGYTESQTVGCVHGLCYELWEKTDPIGWVVVFNTAGACGTIRVTRWPDLIDLLAKLSPIALAAMADWDDVDALFIAARALAKRR